MDDEKAITANYLTTQEDYIDFLLTYQKQALKKASVFKTRAAGFFMVLFGIVFFAFLGGGLYNKIVWLLLVVAGLCTFFYYDQLQPFLTSIQAKNGFAAQKRRLVAQILFFEEKTFTVNTDRYEATLPYSMLYKCVENETLFLLYTGKNEVRFIPKRAVSETECAVVRARLRNALGDKYKKI